MPNNYEQRQEARRARLEARAENIRKAADMTYKTAKDRASVIPFGQPILIGHHSERRDRNYRAKIESGFRKSFELQEHAEQLERRAASVGTGGISSDDPEAVAKLKTQLAECQANQDLWKKINACVRKNSVAGIVALGFTEQQAAKFFEKDFCGRIGIPSYQLSNNNANMKRIKDRIADLEKRAELTPREIEGKGYRYEESTEENRCMFFFDAKPREEVRNVLKSNGFKFSPSRNNAWVRQLNANGMYAAKQVRAKLDSM